MALGSLINKVSIGNLRHRIQLERSTTVDDGAGGGIRTWQAIEETWAKIEPLIMTHDNTHGQAVQSITHRITMRWRNDVDSACRITMEGRIFQIHAITDADERRRFLIAHAEEKSP